MWNNLVSIGDTVMNQVVIRALEAFSAYPLVATGFISAMLGAAGLFLIEVRKDKIAASQRRARDQDRVVRLRW